MLCSPKYNLLTNTHTHNVGYTNDLYNYSQKLTSQLILCLIEHTHTHTLLTHPHPWYVFRTSLVVHWSYSYTIQHARYAIRHRPLDLSLRLTCAYECSVHILPSNPMHGSSAGKNIRLEIRKTQVRIMFSPFIYLYMYMYTRT